MDGLPFRVGLAAIAAVALMSCDDGLVPEFDLVDENPASPSYLETVSPRDYIGQVSAWYFGNAG